MGGLELDPGTRGPRVDTGLRTTRAGVFAAGNLLQGAEPADVAALSGRHAAASIHRWLAQEDEWPKQGIPLMPRPPLQWISPNALSRVLVTPPRGRFALRSTIFVRRSELLVRQDGRVLFGRRIARLVPGRSTSLPSSWFAAVDAHGGAIELQLAAQRH
jgi:hypothetical protein